jgi:hypothetical protein
MKKGVIGCLSLCVFCAKAVVLDESRLITASMKDFVLTFVPAVEQVQYVNYYQEFVKLFNEESVNKQDAARAGLFAKAMSYLQGNSPDTYEVVVNRIHQLHANKKTQKAELDTLERFLERVGVYADFVELKVVNADWKVLQTFADESFVGFLQRIVTPHNQAGFANYYERLSVKINESDHHKQRVTLDYLFEKALSDLEVTHADWHAVLTPYRFLDGNKNAMVTNQAHIFLRRYGAYQEYMELTGQSYKGFFDTVTTACVNLGKTVGEWFGFKSA